MRETDDDLRWLQDLMDVTHARANPHGSSPYSWGDTVVIFRVQPVSMWAYAQNPAAFPHETVDR